ncbi:hypothetical protein CEP49_01760 [Mergibacter septicus]|uniref:terminus macrodomain insulation protein YfbV n=1 Tax=Mergibacter septicus TaxID=221402 RepID=UPI0011795DA7|nr:terminus macrodomain insulation protein YfbV [Mergibacter septicus]AWX13360.1 hypothetical protein CEP49_01760 [Mergibacter septicus]
MLLTLKNGRKYLKTWVLEPRLGMIFPENRIIKMTKFAQNLILPMILLTLGWQYFISGYQYLSSAATSITIIILLLLPLQGYWWLGKRAVTPLPLTTSTWFHHIRQRLAEKETLPPASSPPNYQNLAEILAKASVRLDKSFWQEI